MFRRLEKFDGPTFGEGVEGGVCTDRVAYIQDFNWVTYLGGVKSGDLINGGRIIGILWYILILKLNPVPLKSSWELK